MGDPFFTAPIDIIGGGIPDTPPGDVALCYELHGEAGLYFNLVSDMCTLVNAHYTGAMAGVDVNIIDRVSINAKDAADAYRNISVSLSGGCSVSVDGVDIEREYENDGINIRRSMNAQSRVRVSVPNCNETMFVMWMICENRVLPATGDVAVDMIKFVIARGRSISETAHGVLGGLQRGSSFSPLFLCLYVVLFFGHVYVNKWKYHFSEMKGDVGMSLHEKEGEQEDA